MTLRHIAVLLGVAVCSLNVFSQEAVPKAPVPPWTVLTDPVCPVSSFYSRPLPNTTKELRVMYFPAARRAKLTDPESLTLNIGFNNGSDRPGNRSVAVPFTRTGDHWEATVDASKFHAMYAIFFVSDDKGTVDDNGGSLWDLVFCDSDGSKDVNGVYAQAEGYTGVSWSETLHRPPSYNKAVAIIERYIAQNDPRLSHSQFLLQQLWKYKAQRDGGDAQAWAKLTKELDQFVADHLDNKNALYGVGTFVVRNRGKLDSDFVERTVSTIDAKTNNAPSSFHADLEYDRAVYVTDPHKRLAAFDAFVSKYLENSLMEAVQRGRFLIFDGLGDFTGAEAAFAKYREAADKNKKRYGFNSSTAHRLYLEMARLYIERGIKLDEAFRLIDQAEVLRAGSLSPSDHWPFVDARYAWTRGRGYLALHKPQLAVQEAQKAVDLNKSAENYFLLAQASAGVGDKKNALEPYFQAAILPSNDDLKYGAELKKFYLKKHFGNEKQFEVALEAHRTERFRAAKYVPQLVDQTAPAFEFVTLTGEKLDAAAIRSKTMVVNFWAPG